MALHDAEPSSRPAAGPNSNGTRDVLVIGAGQTGLTVGYYLRQAGLRFLIVDSADQVASAWVERWDSLVLFTPRRYNAMPGQSFEGNPDQEPTRNEVIDYLRRYATEFDLPVELSSQVTRLDYRDGRYVAEVSGRTISADQVIVATGPFQKPRIPEFAASVAPGVYQTHSTGYRRPGDLPPGRVIVIGGGNTGYQIAEELAADHEVVLAVGTRQSPVPRRLLGRQIFWWLTMLGVLRVSVASRLGTRLSHRDTLIGSSPRKARRLGIELKPRAVGASSRSVRFADGTQAEPDAIIWATGYLPDYSWLALPVFDRNGRVRHQRGVTEQRGLYFLGLSWQHTRGSALLGFVSDDARYITENVVAQRRTMQQA